MIYQAINNNLELASKLILKGEIIVYPTDTLYGFGVDATNIKAINKLNKLKQRVAPLSIIVSSDKMIKQFVNNQFELKNEFKNYLPGAFTILINDQNKILPREISLDTGKIGLRIPDSNFIVKLVEKINKPIVTTSVNLHKSDSLNDIDTIANQFNNLSIFASNIKRISIGSTIIDTTLNPHKIVRQGDGIL